MVGGLSALTNMISSFLIFQQQQKKQTFLIIQGILNWLATKNINLVSEFCLSQVYMNLRGFNNRNSVECFLGFKAIFTNLFLLQI